jgi:RsmE family RNA methyltransferase
VNLILLNPEDIQNGKAWITGSKLEHILAHIKPELGETLKAGVINGQIGTGTITEISGDGIALNLDIQNPPPPPLPLKLILAMPRPKVLNRVIQHTSSMGIKEIYIIKTWRVEKSYWETPMLEEENLRMQMITGLEQSRDTILPVINIRKRFKPFVEDELPEIINGALALTAHPSGERACPRAVNTPVTLAIGPEGGFLPYEIDALQKIGFETVSLGERILRVETAIPLLVGRLF